MFYSTSSPAVVKFHPLYLFLFFFLTRPSYIAPAATTTPTPQDYFPLQPLNYSGTLQDSFFKKLVQTRSFAPKALDFLSTFKGDFSAPLPSGHGAGNKDQTIRYNGGRLLYQDAVVNLLWYGTWNTTTKNIISDFLTGFGRTDRLKNVIKSHVYVVYRSALADMTQAYEHSAEKDRTDESYSFGKSFRDDRDVENLIEKTWQPSSAKAIYITLFAEDVDIGVGFGNTFCGWHSSFPRYFNSIKPIYAVIKNPRNYIDECGGGPISPNNDPVADAISNTLASLLVGTLINPNLDAFRTYYGLESGDFCVNNFGSTSPNSNDSQGNVVVNNRTFEIQTFLNYPRTTCTSG